MKKLLAILLLLFAAPCLAQPSTGYATATPDAPSSDGETGFTFIVDLSDMPSSWKAAAENTDATRLRVYRNDGTTRLACDVIDYDYNGGSPTGFVRFKDDMAASPTTYRIYPPVSGNATVLASDTYGSDNAYDANWEGYWPLTDLNDRTSNGLDLTNASATSGATGQIGSCYSFADNYMHVAQTAVQTSPFTIIGWFNPDTSTGDETVACLGTDTNATPTFRYSLYRDETSSTFNSRQFAYDGTTTSFSDYDLANAEDGEWHQYAVKAVSTSSRFPYFDGAVGTEATATLSMSGIDNFIIGRGNGDASGDIDDVQLHSVARSDEWIGEEYLQTSDNTAYWNGWTWNASGASGDPNPLTPTLPGGTPDPFKRILP